MNNATGTEGTGILDAPPPSAGVQRLIDSDVERLGFVMNLSSLWGHQPDLYAGLSDLIDQSARGLTLRQRAILITCCASALGDSYCSLAWGRRFAGEAGAHTASLPEGEPSSTRCPLPSTSCTGSAHSAA